MQESVTYRTNDRVIYTSPTKKGRIVFKYDTDSWVSTRDYYLLQYKIRKHLFFGLVSFYIWETVATYHNGSGYVDRFAGIEVTNQYRKTFDDIYEALRSIAYSSKIERRRDRGWYLTRKVPLQREG